MSIQVLEEKNKKIYEYCVKVNWDEEKIEELSKETWSNVKMIRQCALEYFEKAYEEFKKKYEYYYIEYLEKNDWNLDYIRTKLRYTFYFRDFDEEKLSKLKENYEKDLNSLGGKEGIKRAHEEAGLQELYLEVINPVLATKKIKTYMLWRNDEERELVLNYMYEQFKKNDGIIGDIAANFKITLPEFLKYVNMYSEEKYNVSMINEKSKKLNSKKFVYDKLKTIDDNDIKEIVRIIEKSGINIDTLRSELGDYVIVYGEPKDYEELGRKIRIYREYKRSQAQQQRDMLEQEGLQQKLRNIFDCVEKFINSKIKTKKEFCEQQGIKESTFSYYIEVVKENNPDLYNRYSYKINRNQRQRYAIIAENIKRIVKLMKDGIEEYGIHRDFDLVDFFMNTNCTLDDFFKLAKDVVNSEEMIIIKKFINENKKYEKPDTKCIKSILAEKIIINYETTKDGIAISGTGELFDNEKKEKIFKYLKKHNVPINRKTYNIIFKRYRSGLFDLEENNDKTK